MYGDGTRPTLTQDGKPLPVVTPLNQGFWDLARRSIFSIQTCRACGHQHVPESPVCPHCLSQDLTWEVASGTGTVESWVEFHRAYWDGYQGELPYRVCLVRLTEGPLFISNLLGREEPLRVGLPVRVAFKRASDDISLPVFEVD